MTPRHYVAVVTALAALMAFLVACPSPGGPPGSTVAATALDSLSLADFTGPEGNPIESVHLTTSFVVPLASLGATLTWTCDSIYVSKVDPLSGQVFVSIPGDLTEPATITVSVAASAASDGSSSSKDFSLTIPVIADADKVTEALRGLSGGLIDFSGEDDADSVSGSFQLPSLGNFGTEVEWSLGNAGRDATTVSGVTLVPGDPATGLPATVVVTTPSTGPVSVALTPSVKKKGGTPTAGAPIVLKVPVLTDQEKVDKDAAAIPELVVNALIKAGHGDTIEAITADFALPLVGDRGSSLSWVFAAAWAVSTGPVAYSAVNGTVLVTPATADASLTLTGTASLGAATSAPKAITVKVKGSGSGGGAGSNGISVVMTNPASPTGNSSLSFLDPGSATISSYTLKKGQTQSLSASFAATSYAWYLDGALSTALSTAASCAVDSTGLAYGKHFLLLEAVTSIGTLSGTIAVDVIPEPGPGLTITVGLPASSSVSSLVFQNSASVTVTSLTVGTTTPVSVKTSFIASSLKWYIDDNLVTAISTSSTCAIDAASLAYGRHRLYLEAQVGTAIYSGNLPFDVGVSP
ncbi:MAG: hypothetical protein WCQ50_15750 [Spirochaetota bacterium]